MDNIRIMTTSEQFTQAAADMIVSAAATTCRARGRFSLALSGGDTPQPIYQRLASPALANHIQWDCIHLFWGDERAVPADDELSNVYMVRQSLLNNISIPAENIHPPRGDIDPRLAAWLYEEDLRAFFKDQPDAHGHQTNFDMVLLGLGDDGHTASLFPGSPALCETERWVVAVEHNTPPPPLVPRLTLTLPAINAASQVIFLVSGASKADILGKVLSTECENLPAQMVKPTDGKLFWLIDQAAAAKINT
jgi:6-phosphogluconolactonase